LRILNLNIIESIEIYIKNIFILKFWNSYLDENIYSDKFKSNRIKFIREKTDDLYKKDLEVKKILEKYKIINSEVFINKLTFWEIVRFIQDLKEENKLIISEIIWIKLTLLENWLDAIVYLRNISSHWENIFNKEMIKSVKWKDINKLFWIENNNRYISYFAIISIFRESLIPNYKWEEKVFKKMKQYNIKISDFWQKKETFPNELESEAWKVLVNPLYKKYLKKSNLLENK
jgi:abortive infection bacteriophage resistance protein